MATVPTSDESLQSADSAAPGYSLHLPPSFGRWTGDWDELAKHNMLRMLVLYNKTGFFYDKGRPRGRCSRCSRRDGTLSEQRS